MQAWDGKSKDSGTGYAIFLWVLRTLGLGPAYLLLRLVAFWYVLFAGKVTAPVREFQRRVGLKHPGSFRLRYRNFCFFGESIIDRVAFMAGIQNRFTFSFDGEQYLIDMITEGKGGLLISAHLGNWEIAGFLLKRLETKINIVMYDAEHEKIKAGLEKFTGGRNANIIVVKDDLSHIYAMHDALERNELVCMHADRFVAGSKTISLPFLGETASFPAGPFQVASMFKVPVSFTYAIKRGSLHYVLSATPPRTLGREDGNSGYVSMARAYVDSLEEKAKQYPEQWYNFYHFWKA